MANSDYTGAKTWVTSPGNFFSDRSGYAPSWVILHGTAGGNSAVGIANYLNSVSLSVHYIIDQAGNIVQMVHEADGAYGNGILDPGHDSWWSENLNPNLVTISIEHCKEATDNSNALTEAQKQASFKLVADICRRNGIPARKADAQGGITGHFSIEPINRKDCPGPYPWTELFNYLNNTPAGQGEGMLLHDSDLFFRSHFTRKASNRIHCNTTNIDVALAILDFYINTGGQARLPLTAEFQIIPGVTAQIFESAIITYDPAHKLDNPQFSGQCYLVKINSGVGQAILAKALTDPLNAKVADQLQQLQAKDAQIADLQKQLADQAANPLVQQYANLLNQIEGLAKL